MMSSVENEDWAELIQALVQVEKSICSLGGEDGTAEKIEASRQALKSFHTTAAMLGLSELEQAGLSLEQCLNQQIAPNATPESIYTFGFALNALIEEMKNVASGKIEQINLGEVLRILEGGAAEGKGENPRPESVSGGAATTVSDEVLSDEEALKEIMGSPPQFKAADYSRLERILNNLGGRLVVADGGGVRTPCFQLHFDAAPGVVEQIETLLSPSDPDAMLAPELIGQDTRIQKIVGTIKEFMLALSSGDVVRSQEILLLLAEQQHQAGLYKEIGLLARELHTSLRGFAETLDPVLKEMVEDKIPDSGTRLEHILEITENAANTTLDHVEKMQLRNVEDQKKLKDLREMVENLTAIGEKAHKQLATGRQRMDELFESVMQTHEDLITVLTAQDYQDLTGQVIQKIITLLKDLELKLVNVIRVFGVKLESGKKAKPDELYGPAHKGKVDALHSQDDVDSLLAEFGF